MESNSRFNKRLSELEKSVQTTQPVPPPVSPIAHLSPEEIKQKYLEIVEAPVSEETRALFANLTPHEMVQLYRSKLNESPHPPRKTSRWNRT